MKGIILAGGSGSRLYPITLGTSKQLLPVYDKPMIYYPLSVLMMAGIRDVLVVSTPDALPGFDRLLGDGSDLGLSISLGEQPVPNGEAESFRIGADWIGDDDVALVLGDNLFVGAGLADLLRDNVHSHPGCLMFGYQVPDPRQFGVAEVAEDGTVLSLEEKPAVPKSDIAVTGLYFYDNDVVSIARDLEPSDRGELEITDVNRIYLQAGKAKLVTLDDSYAWFDTGTHDSLLAAGNHIQHAQRDGDLVGCVDEIALRQGFIDAEQAAARGKRLASSPYGKHVQRLADTNLRTE